MGGGSVMSKRQEDEGLGLVEELLQASVVETENINADLVRQLSEHLLETRATLAAVRQGVSELLNGTWMPTSDAIKEAMLFPNANGLVDRWIEELRPDAEQ